ncbi:MAG: hypothetical protein ACW967_04705 [Candidatus Hodarchaeales archaeon]
MSSLSEKIYNPEYSGETWGSIPIFAKVPQDIKYVYGETDVNIAWIVKDLFPDSYIILIDDEKEVSGKWNRTHRIIFNAGNLNVGVHNITITIHDKEKNKISNTVLVTVLERNSVESRSTELIESALSLHIGIEFISFSLFSLLTLIFLRKKRN